MKSKIYYLSLLLFVLSCKSKLTFSDVIPEHDTFMVASKFVNESRVINVWIPAMYQASKDSLPVLYMPDGGIKEDFPHIANSFANLIEHNSIPPMILVGIENTERGRDLSGPSEVANDEQYCPLTDGAKNFRDFITEELVVEINKKYRTNDYKGIVGESLAGLFVVETLMLSPESFDFYIAFDPSIWWNDHYLNRNAKSLLSSFPDKALKFWFAGSDAEDISKYTNNLALTLKESAPSSLIWKYNDEPNEQHNTIFRATKEEAFIWTLNQNE